METSSPRHCRLNAGFTLLELMIAITILMIVMLMIMGSFNAVIHSKVHGEARLTVDRQGRAILWEVANEIRGAVQTANPVSYVVLVGSGQMRDGTPEDAVTVSTLAGGHRRAITGLAPEEIVSYSLSANPNVKGWHILTRSQHSALMQSSTASLPPPTQLADNVVSLHIKYFNGITWLESWDSSQQPPPTQLPLAASIDLVLGTAGGRTMNFSTEVVLPMAVQVW